MFGSKKETATAVPVYTLPNINRKYEIIGSVQYHYAHMVNHKLDPLYELGVEGAKLGADAVIGLVASYHQQAHLFGTAIRYLD